MMVFQIVDQIFLPLWLATWNAVIFGMQWMMGKRLRRDTLIFVKQFGFIAKRSTTEAVNLMRRLMKF